MKTNDDSRPNPARRAPSRAAAAEPLATAESIESAGGAAPFSAPWEARAFALAVALGARGNFRWAEFRDRLIDEIAAADRACVAPEADADASAGQGYYECWLRALERLALDKRILARDEIDRRAEAIAASPPARTRASTRGPIRIA